MTISNPRHRRGNGRLKTWVVGGTALALGLFIGLPAAANADEAPAPTPVVATPGPIVAPAPTPSASDKSTGIYLYKKIYASKPGSWENSGKQTLIEALDGWSWPTRYPGVLPAEVCGNGWAIQADWVHGPKSLLPLIVDRLTHTGVLGSPVLVASRHYDLSAVMAVPACTPTVVTVTPAQPTVVQSQQICTNGVLSTTEATVTLPPQEHVHWGSYGQDANGVIHNVKPGTYTYEATTDEGYKLSTASFTVTVDTPATIDCQPPAVFKPKVPTAGYLKCMANGPVGQNILQDYLQDNVTTTIVYPGGASQDIKPGEYVDNVYTAYVNDWYGDFHITKRFTDGTPWPSKVQSTWDFHFDNVPCNVVTPPVTPPTMPTPSAPPASPVPPKTTTVVVTGGGQPGASTDLLGSATKAAPAKAMVTAQNAHGPMVLRVFVPVLLIIAALALTGWLGERRFRRGRKA